MSETVYHRNGQARVVNTPSDKVAAEWDGFVLTDAPATAEKADYRSLQKAAKDAGIPANQPAADLAKALDASSAGDPITETKTQDNAHTK